VVRPERRTRADLAAVALIVVATLVGVFVLWLNSDARATVSDPASAPLAAAPPAPAVPATLTEAWRAASPATPRPAIAGPAVVTGDGNEVLGRDPATGEVRWRYARDIPLCTVGAAWDRAVAVYRKWHNCSEVTSLRGPTGVRGPQSNTDAEFGTQLLSDGTYVTATGRRVFETWRSDLVRTQQFGIPTDIKNPKNNIRRPNCWYSSEAVGDSRVGVIEKCPGDPSDRITVLKAHPESDETPEEVFSTLVAGHDASVVAVGNGHVAIALRDRSQLVVFNTSGQLVGQFPMPLTNTPPAGPTRVESTTNDGTAYWYTGADTVALDPNTLSPLWTIPGTLGAGTLFTGKLLVPVPGGVAVHDATSGVRERVIPVDRQGYTGPVSVAADGNVLLEQRGSTLVALR
jgi:hypothetical protein